MSAALLRYHMKEPSVTVLGPGRRFALWVQGCHKRCPHCTAPDTRPLDGGTAVTTGALAWEIALSGAEGLTISGGEPFLQATALAEMIAKVRAIRPMNTIVFTGYLYEELLLSDTAQALLSQTDLLIDGAYIAALDDGKGLRGSTNQRLLFLTDALEPYQETLLSCPRPPQQVFAHGAERHIIGIPSSVGALVSPVGSVGRSASAVDLPSAEVSTGHPHPASL